MPDIHEDLDIQDASEDELRNANVPWPESPEELIEYIESLCERDHDYGTAVYAMSMSAVAAFRYVAKRLGVTGFQSSCADMDILRRTRRLEHGFKIIDYSNVLFPQYWTQEKFPRPEGILEENRDEFIKAAEVRLQESGGMHPSVREHLETIASGGTPQRDLTNGEAGKRS